MPHFDQAFGGDTAANYQKYFVPLIGRPIAADLIKAAGIKKGDRVLDVATGTGAAAFLAKEKAGPQGRVAGARSRSRDACRQHGRLHSSRTAGLSRMKVLSNGIIHQPTISRLMMNRLMS